MPPERGTKRAASDDDGGGDLATTEPNQTARPASKKRALPKPLDEEDEGNNVEPSKPKQTKRQRGKKTDRRAPAQAPPPGAREPVNVTRQGSNTSRRTLSNQPLRERVKTVQEVFADSARTLMYATNQTIKALCVLRQAEVTGASYPTPPEQTAPPTGTVQREQGAPSSDDSAQREQTTPPTDPVHRKPGALTSNVPAQREQSGPSTESMSITEYLVDQLFTGPTISGRHWTCEVAKTKLHSREQRVNFWLVEKAVRWFQALQVHPWLYINDHAHS
ncbi:hypothetical protein Q7P36_010668 [Cladosporium allicinum]